MRLALIASAVLVLSGCKAPPHDEADHIHAHNDCQARMDSLILTKSSPDAVIVDDWGDHYSMYWWYGNTRYEFRSHFEGTCHVFEFVDLSY